MKRSASFTLGSCVTRGEEEEEGKEEGEEEGEEEGREGEEEAKGFADMSFCSCD